MFLVDSGLPEANRVSDVLALHNASLLFSANDAVLLASSDCNLQHSWMVWS